jgi:hypothetical protein
LIGDAADHLVDSFLFNGDSRVDVVFKSGRVRGDSVEFHGDRFGSGYLASCSFRLRRGEDECLIRLDP